jgi:WD40 repeat protein
MNGDRCDWTRSHVAAAASFKKERAAGERLGIALLTTVGLLAAACGSVPAREPDQGPNGSMPLKLEGTIRFTLKDGTLNGIALSPDGKELVASCWDSKKGSSVLRKWEVATVKESKILGVSVEEIVADMALLSTGEIMSSGSRHGAIIWDAATLRPKEKLAPQARFGLRASGASASADGKRFAAYWNERQVAVWRSEDRKLVWDRIVGDQRHIHGISLSPDGALLAIAHNERDANLSAIKIQTEIWSVDKNLLLTRCDGEGLRVVRQCHFIPGQSLLAEVFTDSTLRLLDIQGKRQPTIVDLGFRFNGLTFADEGRIAIVRGWVQGKKQPEYEIRVFNTKTWKLLYRQPVLDEGALSPVASVSRDGKLMALLALRDSRVTNVATESDYEILIFRLP